MSVNICLIWLRQYSRQPIQTKVCQRLITFYDLSLRMGHNDFVLFNQTEIVNFCQFFRDHRG